MKCRRLLLIVSISVVTNGAQAADVETIRTAWEKELAQYDDVIVNFTTKATVKSGTNMSAQENSGVIKKLGPNRLAYLVQTPTTVTVANTKYAFTAVSSQNGGWTLATYGLLGDGPIQNNVRRLNDLVGGVTAPYSISTIPLLEHLGSFRIDSDADNALTLSSTADLESQDSTNKLRLSNIRLKVENASPFRLLESSATQLINKSSGKLSCTYRTSAPTGSAQQSTITTTETYGDVPSGLVIESMTQYKFQFRAGLKDTDFRLTAYGLPEPSDVVWEKPTPLYVWLLVAAGVFGVLALLFRWMVRRRQEFPVAA